MEMLDYGQVNFAIGYEALSMFDATGVVVFPNVGERVRLEVGDVEHPATAEVVITA